MAPRLQLDQLPNELYRLFHELKDQCMEQGASWRSAFDAWRPHHQALWQKLSLQEKKYFLNRLLPYWNIHRHRAPPAALAAFNSLSLSGRLSIIKGKALSITEKDGLLRVRLRQSATGKEVAFSTKYLLNCSGPNYKVADHPSPLLQHLLNNKLASTDNLGLGFAVDDNMSLLGPLNGKLFAVGSLLFGTLFETTAVPEIRHQCAALTQTLLKETQPHAA